MKPFEKPGPFEDTQLNPTGKKILSSTWNFDVTTIFTILIFLFLNINIITEVVLLVRHIVEIIA